MLFNSNTHYETAPSEAAGSKDNGAKNWLRFPRHERRTVIEPSALRKFKMTLVPVEFDYRDIQLPDGVSEFLTVADKVVERHRINTATNFHGFVPSDYVTIYQCCQSIFDSHLLSGDRFCEWGSGVCVVAALAAMIGYESYGIEYNSELVDAALQLCEEFEVELGIVQGSFVPDDVEDLVEQAFAMEDGELAMHTEPDSGYDELGHDISDFDLIFAYPWPTDIQLVRAIFDRFAAPGAMLLLYFDMDDVGLFRKS